MGKSSFLTSAHLLGWFLMFTVLISGCRPEPEPVDLIPADGAPGIAVIAPSSTRIFQQAGESGTVTLRLADNEELTLLRIVPEIYNQRDSLVSIEDPSDASLSGRTQDYEYAYTVPNLDPYFKVRYRCYLIDLAGQSAETSFWISVMPGESEPPIYETLSYENDTIYNSLNGSYYAFNFSARQALPRPGQDPETIELQMDIAESSTGQVFWEPRLMSPNNTRRGNDSSVFVITSEDRFNYEAANYNTIFRAFNSDPAPSATAPPTEHPIAERNKAGLEIGDIVIVKLIQTPMPQFAVMRVKELVDDGPGINVADQLIFDYKITSP